MYARICPECGCYLDPGEKCDCIEQREQELKLVAKMNKEIQKLFSIDENGQYRMAV